MQAVGAARPVDPARGLQGPRTSNPCIWRTRSDVSTRPPTCRSSRSCIQRSRRGPPARCGPLRVGCGPQGRGARLRPGTIGAGTPDEGTAHQPPGVLVRGLAGAARPRHPCEAVSVIRRLRPEHDAANPLERRVWRLRWLLAGFSSVLGILVLFRLGTLERPIDLVILGVLPLVAATELASWHAVEAREARRRAAAEDMARILHGFSRAVSQDGIVEAILAEVGRGTGADHLVVVQRRPGTPILDATLVPTRSGGQASSAFLPAVDLEPDPPPGPVLERRGSGRTAGDAGSAGRDPAGAADAVGVGVAMLDGAGDAAGVGIPVGPGRGPALVADEAPADARAARASLRGQPDPAAAAAAVAARVEARVRRAFGISHTLAVPLVAR